MDSLMEIVAALMILAGTIFLSLGGLGLVRMPDLYNRIQAGTKATTLGTLLTLIGLAIMHPDWIPKLVLIGFFMLFTNPLSSQVLARAAHRTNLEKSSATKVDQLADDREGEQ